MSDNIQRDDSALESRYYVKRLNDTKHKHDDCRYFVLDPQHDPLARKALIEYSKLAVEAGLIGLAADLRLWVVGLERGDEIDPGMHGLEIEEPQR